MKGNVSFRQFAFYKPDLPDGFSTKNVEGARYTFRKAELDGDSRVYLDGHGDWQNRTLGGATGRQLAWLLQSAGMPAVRVVSVTGCELARDTDDVAAGVRVGHSISSFAGDLHKFLFDFGIKTSVYARSYKTFSGRDKFKMVSKESKSATKYSGDTLETSTHRLAASKYKFFWEGDKQKCEPVVYPLDLWGAEEGSGGLF